MKVKFMINQHLQSPLLLSFSSKELQEDLPMDQYSSTVPQLHGRLDPISYGSYLDAAIPFPRTSGAKFCACGEWTNDMDVRVTI